MFVDHQTSTAIANAVCEAAKETLAELRSEECTQEPALTDRLLARIKTQVNGKIVNGIVWRAKTMSDRGPGAQERRTGADFAAVLNVSLKDFSLTKGFLAQAKLIEPSESVSASEARTLFDQCNKMLSLSPDSFVFLYTRLEIKIVPALSVLSATPGNPHRLKKRSLYQFFIDHLASFIGDRAISGVTDTDLNGLLQRSNARSILFIQALSEQ